MAAARDNGTSPAINFGMSTDAGAQTRPTISEISTNTTLLNLRDSTSQMDSPMMQNSMAQVKPATDTAMASAGPTTEEAATSIAISGKDFSTQAQMTTSSGDAGISTETTSVKSASSMTSPTRKTNTGSQFRSTTNTSSTMTAPKVQDGGTSPVMTGSSTRQTQYESTTVNRSINTRN